VFELTGVVLSSQKSYLLVVRMYLHFRVRPDVIGAFALALSLAKPYMKIFRKVFT